jgi:hypothetical protein
MDNELRLLKFSNILSIHCYFRNVVKTLVSPPWIQLLQCVLKCLLQGGERKFALLFGISGHLCALFLSFK